MTVRRHQLIKRQLRKSGLDETTLDAKINAFLDLVNAAYYDFECDRNLLERSIELSSREMEDANRALRNLAEDSQRAARCKSDFLANMSHEIRTPINGIIGLCDMLKERSIDPESDALVELLTRSSRGLLSVINDVLDISKIEAGKLSIVPRDTNIRALVSDLTTLFLAAAREKCLEVVAHIEDCVPENILIDDGRVRQIATNLIGNAVKFTPDNGGVIVYLTTNIIQNSVATLSFCVADSGIGIRDEDLVHIFEAFNQVNSSVSRKFGGTGLGLTITHKLVEIMGGEMVIRSRPGIGSMFRAELPFLKVEERNFGPHELDTKTSSPNVDRPNTCILLVEDNTVNQKVAVHALQKLGFSDIAVANSGKQAIAQCDAKTFDIILMDCQMPEMSGFEAATHIREKQNLTHVPIIALTALAMSGDREKCLASGMNDYLSKPFKKEELERIILKWVS